MNLFQLGSFVLSSGVTSNFRIDCDALTPEDWQGLAAMACEMLPPFGQVIGVPRGGVPFADALRPHCHPLSTAILVVDDVLTTGASMERTKALAAEAAPLIVASLQPEILGLVVFARGPLPGWVKAICPLPPELWVEKPIRCSACKAWSQYQAPEIMQRATADGFHFRWFTCQRRPMEDSRRSCPPTYHCTACMAKLLGCAFCGNHEEYT